MKEQVKTRWNKSAEMYHRYGLKYSQYRETSHKLVETAGIEEGQVVVDLASGTGFTTQKMLEKEENLKIHAVDPSKAMLEKAREYIESERVVYIQSDAENFAEHIKEKVDRVVCNSAFWYFDTFRALENISSVLKEKGLFAFNLNQQFHENSQESHRKPVIEKIIEELDKRGYRTELELPYPLNRKQIEEALKEKGMRLETVSKTSFEGASLEDSIEFFRIPAVSPFFENLSEPEREDILETVRRGLEAEDFPFAQNTWTNFVARKEEDK